MTKLDIYVCITYTISVFQLNVHNLINQLWSVRCLCLLKVRFSDMFSWTDYP